MTCSTIARTAAEIAALVRAFEDCTLPRACWDHAAHLTVALWYLKHHAVDEATVRMRSGIQRYNRASGNGIAYHETMTLAWLALIRRFLLHFDRGQKLEELAERLVVDLCNKDLLFFFYGRERLLSDRARQQWVPPDLHPIDDAIQGGGACMDGGANRGE